MARRGKSAAKRQGAVSADSSGSEIAPLLIGGLHMSSPSGVDDNDVAWMPVGEYGEPWIGRFSQTVSLTVGSAAADLGLSGSVDFRSYHTMIVTMPTAWTAASIGFLASDSQTGTYRELYDQAANYVVMKASACRALISPSEIAGARYLKLRSDDGSAGSVAQSADRALTLTLKA